MAKCMYCKEIEVIGKAKYCSDSCKMKAFRTRQAQKEILSGGAIVVPDVLPNRNTTVTDNNRNVTVTPTVTVIPKPKDVGITFDDAGDVHVPDGVFTKLMAQAKPGHIRVSKPGDADYKPLCATTRVWMHQWARGRT